MSGQHTPGPWQVQKEALPNRVGITATNGRFITWTMGGAPNSESEANARLIAAAPDLLEALEVICREFANGHPLIQQGRAAIAKARGEE